jgi:hypothetical protein
LRAGERGRSDGSNERPQPTGLAADYRPRWNFPLAGLKKQFDVPRIPPALVKEKDDRSVISYPEPASSSLRPSADKLRLLYEIVLRRYPQLAPESLWRRWRDDDADDHFQGFVSSFERLGFIGRTEIDKRYYVSHWTEEARQWLTIHRPGLHGNIGADFLAAVVAHGDIPYVVGDPSQGIVWSIGVSPFRGMVLRCAFGVHTLQSPVDDAGKDCVGHFMRVGHLLVWQQP